MYHLNNGVLNITIAAKGAEIQSIRHTANQLEYMWSADLAFWNKKSPVLFPIVGGLKNGSYQYKGNTYALGRHGFAREKEFTVTAQTATSIRFTLLYDAETLSVYPFLFSFSVIYTLDVNKLTVNYLVENTGKDTMYFSVGAHPAFKVPLVAGTNYTDYYLQFDQKENAGKWPLSREGLIESTPVTCLENTNTLPLTKELFYGDALVFKHLHSTSISILSHKTTNGLKVQFDNFPYMGIWSFKNADFVCIEPWCGIADSVNVTGDITTKEGINLLSPADQFARSWSVELF